MPGHASNDDYIIIVITSVFKCQKPVGTAETVPAVLLDLALSYATRKKAKME